MKFSTIAKISYLLIKEPLNVSMKKIHAELEVCALGLHKIRLAFFLLIFVSITALQWGPVHAGYATLSRVDVTIPSSAEVGQEIVVQASVFASGCSACFASNIQALLILPSEASLSYGFNPAPVGNIRGGSAKDVGWIIVFSEPGSYILQANASGVDSNMIPVSVFGSASVEVFLEMQIHDVGIVGIMHQKTVVGQGYSPHVNVTVENQGDMTESFDVTIYWNTTEIDTKEATLSSRDTVTIMFYWNTTGLAEYKSYALSAYAQSVPFETDTADNTVTDGTVFLVHVGDVNTDEKVRVNDILAVAMKFGSSVGDSNWDPNCDINCDDKTRVDDVFAAANNFGWP